ncbi:hypothetical protein [Streptomyces hydrogenans]|uniref:hypothetical protein n=1 Tax=Streptomyces hydrogenans TaxID=1873719 RepID=UPI001CFF0AF1|nr:hypothetical protein [Streptomyces hydrogenans]
MTPPPLGSPALATHSLGGRTPQPRRNRHFVRGLSYGTGLTLAGLLGYWIQQML